MNKTPNYPDDILNSSPNINPKFSPKDILKQSPDQEKIGDKTIEEQLKYFNNDPFKKQQYDHNKENQKMKSDWSLYMAIYVAAFTLLMFSTLWLSNNLEPITLNSLIISGFANVFGVVYAIVSHLFPKPIKN